MSGCTSEFLLDHALASELATAAGRRLVALRSTIADGSALKAAGDRSSHEFLMAELARCVPNDGVVSEEGERTVGRATIRRTWIVDPLDGTREYSEPPRDDWAVHVALVIDGQPIVGQAPCGQQGEP